MTFPGKTSRKIAQRLRERFAVRPPGWIAQNFRELNPQALNDLEAGLVRLSNRPDLRATPAGRAELQDHLFRRLTVFRHTIIPWLSSARPLDGARILEVGCGTGSSTVALAEQGAQVTAIDISEAGLQIARERCQAYGLSAEFCHMNVIDAARAFTGRQFDWIIFFATLEHMTHAERISAMRSTWNMLDRGAFWCVVEAPNRLWYNDGHTSLLPFFHWLPDDLAFQYLRFSPREGLSGRDVALDDESLLDFLRLGRGVSYHEFELAMDRLDRLDVLSCLHLYLREQSWLRRARWKFSVDGRYEALLARFAPDIHRGFLQGFLDLIIRKN